MKVYAFIAVALTCLFVAAFFAALAYGVLYAVIGVTLMEWPVGAAMGAPRMLAAIVFFLALAWAIGNAIKTDAYGRSLRQVKKVK